MMRSLICCLLLAVPTAAPAQAAPTKDAVPLYDGLGEYTRTVSTRSSLAQRYFDQGLRLTYGFGHEEAQRAFREAIRHDSLCAMCHWGLAWSLGPYINMRMDSASGVAAYAAVQRAMSLRARTTPVERSFIEAMARRYARSPTRANRAPLDSAYARAMRDVVRRHPDDLDAAALLGEALMVLRPWDQWTREGDPQPGTDEVLQVLESVLARDLRHPGACHHYIHATEASRDPGRASRCAEHLGDVIPGASHVPHMPSHTWMRVGRYGDAVRANQRAWLADQRAGHDGAPSIYPSHNLHMLFTAAAMDGQAAVSMQAARDLARGFPNSAFYQHLSLVRFGRWNEIMELPILTANRFQRGLSYFARGMAQLALDSSAAALQSRDSLQVALDSTTESQRFRGHPQRSLLGVALAMLEAELAMAAGERDRGISVLRTALALEDSLVYDEPEPWPIPLRHVLGAVLLEAENHVDAETAYREDLRKHPANGWALFGLVQALRGQGREQEATEVQDELARAWARSDVWLTGSRFAPTPRRTPPAHVQH